MKKVSLTILLVLTTLFCFTNKVKSQIVKAYVTAGGNLSQFDGDEAFGFKKIGVNAGIGAEVNINKMLSMSIETNFNQKGSRLKGFRSESPTGAYKLNLSYVEIPLFFSITDKTNNFKLGVGASYGYAVSTKEFEDRLEAGHKYLLYNPPSPEERNANNIIMYKDFVPNDPARKGFEYLELVNEWNNRGNNNKINPHDFSILGDLTIRMWEQLFLNIRYSYSLRSLRRVDYYITGNIDLDQLEQRKIDYYQDDIFTVKQRKGFNNTITFRILYIINEKQSNKTRGLIKGADSEVKKQTY
ncbi:MAG: outer membrane beta-barrel protein [Bacteroidales bacterium]|jgi:hypothetical protein